MIASGIASGLLYLHTYNVIHGDIKSANVLLTSDLVPKLSDFGLSKVKHDTQTSQTSTVYLRGTLGWMAPEIFLDQDISRASDVYSFAILLWEMASKQIPWAGLGMFLIGQKIVNGNRPEIPAPTPTLIQNCIKECWVGEPTERPTMESVANKLSMIWADRRDNSNSQYSNSSTSDAATKYVDLYQ